MTEEPDSLLNSEPQKRFKAIDIYMLVLGWIAMLLFAFHSSTHMVGAGDTWVAMACGRHFINHGVDTVEPFSANSHKAGPTEEEIENWPGWARTITDIVGIDTVRYWHPTGWVNQNWLTHVIFYWLTHMSPVADATDDYTYESPPGMISFNSLVYWKIALYVLTIICVYYSGRLLGAHPALCATFACFAVFAGRSFYDIRPAGFSNLLVAVYLLILLLATYRHILFIWLLVPAVVFWCNVHGGYIYAFIMLAPFFGLHLLTYFLPKKWGFITIGKKGLIHTAAAGFAAFIASIILNPFHLTNMTHTFIISLSEHAEMWRTVNEWHPAFAWDNPVGTGFPYLILFVMSFGLLVLWFISKRLKPSDIKLAADEYNYQQRIFGILSTLFAWVLAVAAIWTVFLSLSFLSLEPNSFFACMFFIIIILLAVQVNIHFIWLSIIFTAMAMIGAEQNAARGGYIYAFMLIPTYVLTWLIASAVSAKVRYRPINIVFVVAAAVVSMLIVFYHKPFAFSQGDHWLPSLNELWNLKRPWRPVYEKNIESSYDWLYSWLFKAIYILNIVLAGLWVAVPKLKSMIQNRFKEESPCDDETVYQRPPIDLSAIIIALLTMYMAYRSRRFITIAAIAMCPIVAMLIDRIVRQISASRNFFRHKKYCVGGFTLKWKLFFSGIATIVVLGLGIWWGIKFKWVYLDPWPTDNKLTSVFMRMTASDAKPFWAMKFIRDNKISGKMFNHWTEGGFIAWGQVPDPNTGKTPLQLFMDGRAQAAYDPSAFTRWSSIMRGGPVGDSAMIRRRKLNASDYVKIGNWLSQEFRRNGVDIVMMPAKEWNNPVVKGLEHNLQWPIVFMNNKQKIFADLESPQGKRLFQGMMTGETKYPNDYSKYISIARNIHIYTKQEDSPRKALQVALKAINTYPSQIGMFEILMLSRYPGMNAPVAEVCKQVLEQYEQKHQQWSQKSGYYHPLTAAILSTNYLLQTAQQNKDAATVAQLKQTYDELTAERSRTIQWKRW